MDKFNDNNTRLVANIIEESRASIDVLTEKMNERANEFGEILKDFNDIVRQGSLEVSIAMSRIALTFCIIAFALFVPESVKENLWLNGFFLIKLYIFEPSFSAYQIASLFFLIYVAKVFVYGLVSNWFLMAQNQELILIKIEIQELLRQHDSKKIADENKKFEVEFHKSVDSQKNTDVRVTKVELKLSKTVPLFRYYRHNNGGNHFYTTSKNEIGTTTRGQFGKHGMQSEGIQCYVFSNDVSHC